MGIENPVHILFIALVALVVLGPKRLPEVARALGQGIREFRESINTHPDQQIAHEPVPGPPIAVPQPQVVYDPAAAPPVAPPPAEVNPAPVAQPPDVVAQPAAATPAPEQGQPADG